MLVCGGLYASTALASCERLTPGSTTFAPTAPLLHPRAAHRATRLDNGQVLIVGGHRGRLKEVLPAEIYDPVRGTFAPAGTPLAAFWKLDLPVECVALPDGSALVLCAGTALVERWHQNRFEPWGSVAVGPSPWMHAFSDGRVLIAGAHGCYISEGPAAWRALSTPKIPRQNAVYAALPDGRVLVAGGAGRPALKSAEILDVNTGRWTPAAPMETKRQDPSAVALSDGAVLVAGGQAGLTVTRACVVYDAMADVWLSAGASPGVRAHAVAVQTGPDRVLLVGGRAFVDGHLVPATQCLTWQDDHNEAAEVLGHAKDPNRVDPHRRDSVILRALQRDYHSINADLFANRLRPVVMELTDKSSAIAEWLPNTLTIRFSRSAVSTMLWPQVKEILRHEMAHQFVSEVLGIRDESAHGPAFQATCAQRGIDARAVGVPTVTLTTQEQTVVRRVQKLRALATSSNTHEAHSAATLADELCQQYRQLFSSTLEADDGAIGVRHLGGYCRRRSALDNALASLLVRHTPVDVVWVHAFDPHALADAWVLEAAGTLSALERAAYLYEVVHRGVTCLWEADVQVHGGGHRDGMRFKAAAVDAFCEKLDSEHLVPGNAALVRVEQARAADFVATRYPRRSRGGYRSITHNQASMRGREAGKSLEVRDGMSGPTGPRLLRPSGA